MYVLIIVINHLIFKKLMSNYTTMKYKRDVCVSSLLQIAPVSFVGGGRVVGASVRLSGQQSTVHLRDPTADSER